VQTQINYCARLFACGWIIFPEVCCQAIFECGLKIFGFKTNREVDTLDPVPTTNQNMTHVHELELVFQIKGATVASTISIPQYQRMYERMLDFIAQGDTGNAVKSVALHQLVFDPSKIPAGVREALDIDGEFTVNLTDENSTPRIELRNGRVIFSIMAHVVVKLRSAMATPAFISWYEEHQTEFLRCFTMLAGNVQGGEVLIASPVCRAHAKARHARFVAYCTEAERKLQFGRSKNDRATCHSFTAKPKQPFRKTTSGRLV